MQLKLTHSQRIGGVLSTTVVFCLDARAQLTAEEQANVRRYKLGGQIIYSNAAAKKHYAEGKAALQDGSALGSLKALKSLALSHLHLNITIDGLQRGQHIECKDLDELLGAEEALMTACENLKAYLACASAFDGREVLIDFSDTKPTVAVSPTSMRMLAPPSEASVPSPPIEPSGPSMATPIPDAPVTAPAAQYAAYVPPTQSVNDQIANFWDTKTGLQKIGLIVGGFILLSILANIIR